MSQGAVLGDTDCGGCKEGLDGGFGAQGGHRALARLSWHGANDHSVDTRQLLVLQIANIIAELFIYCFCQC